MSVTFGEKKRIEKQERRDEDLLDRDLDPRGLLRTWAFFVGRVGEKSGDQLQKAWELSNSPPGTEVTPE